MSAVAVLDPSGAEAVWKQVQNALPTLPLATSVKSGEAPLEIFSQSTTNTSQPEVPPPAPAAAPLPPLPLLPSVQAALDSPIVSPSAEQAQQQTLRSDV